MLKREDLVSEPLKKKITNRIIRLLLEPLFCPVSIVHRNRFFSFEERSDLRKNDPGATTTTSLLIKYPETITESQERATVLHQQRLAVKLLAKLTISSAVPRLRTSRPTIQAKTSYIQPAARNATWSMLVKMVKSSKAGWTKARCWSIIHPQKRKRRRAKDKLACQLGTHTPTGPNVWRHSYHSSYMYELCSYIDYIAIFRCCCTFVLNFKAVEMKTFPFKLGAFSTKFELVLNI